MVGMSCDQTRRSIEKKTEKVDLKNLSTSDLKSLKKNDPFMYYSIPSVRDASFFLEDIDIANIDKQSIRHNCTPCPSGIKTIKSMSSEQSISRKSRISFECHIDLLMQGYFDEESEEEEDDDLGVN